MIAYTVSKKDLEKRERQALAPYAVLNGKSLGREFPETEDFTRTCFQRDRDRIIHCKPFRRLSGKTQVFVATYGDHFRDRLSHTLEVAQIARDLARNLRLNEDLCETIALAHDLGHTPFGHAGEQTLNEIMMGFGSHFEHNEQSRRIVEVLEKQFPNFEGLNLSFEVRAGLSKHQTSYDQKGRKIAGKTLEAQIVDIADEIAYHNHDVDDGLRSELFSLNDLKKVAPWREVLDGVYKKYGRKLEPVVLRHRAVSHLISMMIENVLKTTESNLKKYKIRLPEDVVNHKKELVGFSSGFNKKVKELRQFLWDKMYKSPQVMKHSEKGQKVLGDLFRHLYKQPKLMPKSFWGRIDAPDPLHIVVKDYVAGCTDTYAYEMSKV
ncbi:deoxyguanosinetriphosphate triphosphohydrolase [Candidatus Peregrinibacteria bacterium]|nr:deoxyguanosinetriphosphate triphosphohydrolase [Candidatus Peregrinibacteria bacterium]